MLTNRKIRKAIKNEFEQPPPFDEFCKQAGIEFPSEQKESKKRRWWIPVVSTAAASVIIVCGCIPLMLPKGSQDGQDKMPIYAEENVVYIACDMNELLSYSNIVLFDFNAMQQFNYAYFIYPVNDRSLCLGYRVNEIDYEKQINDILYSYLFDYMVRSYRQFMFVDLDHYINLTDHFEYNGLAYNYQIADEIAYISFSVGETDYFISLKGRDGVTEINKESVETFIEIAF